MVLIDTGVFRAVAEGGTGITRFGRVESDSIRTAFSMSDSAFGRCMKFQINAEKGNVPMTVQGAVAIGYHAAFAATRPLGESHLRPFARFDAMAPDAIVNRETHGISTPS